MIIFKQSFIPYHPINDLEWIEDITVFDPSDYSDIIESARRGHYITAVDVIPADFNNGHTSPHFEA